jgi:hypothetical protein
LPRLLERFGTAGGWWPVPKVIDEVIIDAIADGRGRVLNLAAGLDTRPYRLDLPSDFTWVEADLPQLLAKKEQVLADETPRCRLRRHAVDLADPADRDASLNEELAGRDGFGLLCGPSVRPAPAVDATAGVAASARSTQTGQQYVQRGCPP